MKITEKIIKHRKLENGMELFFYDNSRLMAEDRWLLDVICEAYIPLTEKFWDMVTDEDPGQLTALRKMLGDKLVFSSRNERVFIDEKQKEALLKEMAQNMYDTILAYIKRPDFPQQLFKKEIREARQKLLIRKAMDRAQGRLEEE